MWCHLADCFSTTSSFIENFFANIYNNIFYFLVMIESVLSHANIRVSSVLNRDSKEYGKKNMFDDNGETCWNSDQGTPQWVHLDFIRPVSPREIRIQFQGGFAGRDCTLEGQLHDHTELIRLKDFYPEDENCLQVFQIHTELALKNLRIMFNNSTDFFGRIVVYKLDVLGETG